MKTLLPSAIAAKLPNIYPLILPLTGVLMTGIFLLDLVSPLGWAVWLLYLLPLFLTFWFSHPQYLIPLATICAALILVGFIHSPPGIPVEVAAFNRSMGVVVLWIMTVLLRQHMQTEETVRRKEHEKQIILDSVPAMIWYRDKDNRILRANISAAKSIGRSVEEVEGKRTEELYPAEAAQYRADDLEVINSGKAKFGVIEPYQVASGEKRWVQADKIPYRDQNGATLGVIVCAVDITDCVRAEEALHKAQEELELRVQERTSELRRTIELLKREDAERRRAENAFRTSLAYFQTFMDNSPVVAFIKDEEGRLVYVNRLWERTFLKTSGEVIGKPDVELWPPETVKQFRENDRAAFAAGRTVELEEIVPTPDGTPHTWVVFKFVLRGPSERRLLGGVALDITERKRVEEALRESEARLQAILDNSPSLIFLKDTEGRYLLVNQQFEKVFHRTREEIVGRTDEELFPPAEASAYRANDRQALQAGVPLEFEEVALHDDGPHTSIVFKFPLRTADGKAYAIGGIATDFTERKRAEEALRRSEEQLRLALEERERLSQDLHDNIIQTIYAIGMELEECQHLMTEDETIAVKKLRHAVAQLNLVIRDVRNYIVVEEPDRISAVQLRTELTKLARAMNGAHSLRFRISLDPLAASQLTPEETKHVLSIAREAMSNSLRHSGARSGIVSLQMEHGALRLMVEDSGVGFDPQALEARGQGLRNIAARAQKLGARCQVTSEHGHGTRILIDIPKEQVHASAGD